ncbi:MAG: nitrogenase component 1 [Oscillospiraceae bacterium]
MEKNRQLSYFIPQHIPKKVTLRIPDSHSLHICPAACGRRNGIRAIKNGEKEHVSFLTITQADLISGGYEHLVGNAVEELLGVLKPRPRAFHLYVNCVDDFLGTDEAALVAELEERFPDLRFAVFHIDPVAEDAKVTPGMRMHAQLYTFLQPLPRDDGINFIGNFASLHPDCELLSLFRQWNVGPVREIFRCADYAAYEDMARSRLNVVLMQMGEYAAQQLQKRLGTPYLYLPADYRLETFQEYYAALAQALDRPLPDLTGYRSAAQAEIAATRQALGDRAVIVDSSASLRPFALALALLEYGFSVRAVFAPHMKNMDSTDRARLEQAHPEVAVVRREGYQDILGYGFDSGCLCIGFDSAFLLKAPHFVDMYHDEGYYGYHGICRLMREMRGALEQTADWEAKA